MPCWSVLESEVDLSAVDPRLLTMAAGAERWRVSTSGNTIVLQAPRGVDASIEIDRAAKSARLVVRGSEFLTWGGVRYRADSPDLMNAIKRAVAVQAVFQAACAVGGRVVAASGGRARIVLSR